MALPENSGSNLDPRNRPAEYAGAVVASAIVVLVACGVAVPAAAAAAIPAFVSIVVTGIAATRRK